MTDLSVEEKALDASPETSTSQAARYPAVFAISRRLLLAIPLLFVVSALSFLLVSLTPGDVAQQIVGTNASDEAYQKLRAELNLDRPVYEQYGIWVGDALQGDLGRSLFNGETVTKTIVDRLAVTLSLVVLSLIVISVLGVGLGIFGAVRGGVPGQTVDTISLIGFALPGFWVGAVLVALFSVKLHWFPAIGYVPISDSPNEWLRAMVLPVVALALHSVAVLAKQTREAMLDALASEHVRMAWANGIPSRTIYYKLALKNASPRIVTIIGLQTVGLLVGTLFIEKVFALPGLGSALVESASHGDLPVVQGITVFFALIIVGVNLVVDLTYSLLDPRVRAA